MKNLITLIALFSITIFESPAQTLDELRELCYNVAIGGTERKVLIKETTKFILKDKSVAEVFLMRAFAYELSDPKKSIEDYKTAIELDSKNPDAHNGLGNVLYLMAKNDEALVHYKLAYEYSGGGIIYLHGLANVYEAILDYEAWESTAILMVEQDEDLQMSQFGSFSLARLYVLKGDKEEAVNHYIAGCEMGNADGDAFVETAKLLLELNRQEEACDYLEQAKLAYDYQYNCCPEVPALIEEHCEN